MICNIYIACFLPKCLKKIKTKKFSMLDLYVSHVKNCIVCKTLTKTKRSLSVYLLYKTTNFICQKLLCKYQRFLSGSDPFCHDYSHFTHSTLQEPSIRCHWDKTWGNCCLYKEYPDKKIKNQILKHIANTKKL